MGIESDEIGWIGWIVYVVVQVTDLCVVSAWVMVDVVLVKVGMREQDGAMDWEAWHGRGWQGQVSLDGRTIECQEGELVGAMAWRS